MGIDSLAGIIERKFKLDPFQENILFMFCGRKSTRIKCLLWEGDGFLLLYKRLEGGRFQWPRSGDDVSQITQEEFTALMSGLSIIRTIKRMKPKTAV